MCRRSGKRKSVSPARLTASGHAVLQSPHLMGSPRYVQHKRGSFPLSPCSTATASRFNGTPRGVPFSVRFNHTDFGPHRHVTTPSL